MMKNLPWKGLAAKLRIVGGQENVDHEFYKRWRISVELISQKKPNGIKNVS